LDVLADRKLNGMWSGEIYINGHPRMDDFRLRTAYVLQDDVLISTLTVAETLFYSCWSRVRSLTTKEQIQDRVDTLLKMMNITHIRDSIVGDAMRKGISGGQLKRLCIANELVALPDVIFLDEPTSGLDSSIALEVMTAVKNIVGPTKLCISTIHQPSPEVFELFDKLVLMCNGRLVYYGDTKESVHYFTRPQMGYKYQMGSNPAEFVIAVGGGTQCPEGTKVPRQPEELETLFKASKFYQPLNITRVRSAGEREVFVSEATPFVTQAKMLFSRTWLAKIRDTTDLRAQLGKNVFVGLLVGIVFYNQGDASSPFYNNGVPEAQVNTINSIMFMNMMYTMIGNLQAIPYLCSQNLVYRRELASNAYSPLPYWISMLTTILPLQLFFHIIYFMLMYWMVNLPRGGDYFMFYISLLFFSNITALYMAMWLAAATASEALAFALFPILFLFLTNFSGYALTIDSVPPFWSWAPDVSYARWYFEGLMVNQWGRYDTDDEPVENGYGDILSAYGFNNFDKENSFGIGLLYIIGFAALLYIALLPPRNRMVKLEQGEMTTSAAVSFVERKSKSNQKKSAFDRTISLFEDSSTLLRETLIGGMDERDDDEYIEPQVAYNVEFYRVSSGMLDKADGTHLVFKNLNYSVPNKMNPKEEVMLLCGVTGQVHAGEMCALMGASGAGKSTLLDVLAGRKTTGTITGDILYNGSKELRASAYVMQVSDHQYGD
jgi:ABC-type multidrug transport system ATPase subunit/ABC-type multidrug transport system permease subunit